MRWLGVDFGFTRIGIAVGESEVGIASPRPAITAQGALKKDAAQIYAIAQKEEVDGIVLGVPLSEDDDRMERICRQLGGHLEALGATVRLVDESMTSVAAEANLRQVDLTAAQRRRHRDGEAACQILMRFFEVGDDQP